MSRRARQLAFDFITERERGAGEAAGVVETVIFSNPDTGWKVIVLADPVAEKQYTLAGYLPGVKVRDRIRARGTYSTHPRFGACLQVDEFAPESAHSRDAVSRYLIAAINGIGPTLAERIIAQHGDRALAVIEQQPEQLLAVPGMTRATLDKIIASTRAIDSTVRELILLGFSPLWAGRIYQRYGEGAASAVRQRPFKLITDFKGIGFRKADLIARQAGLDLLSDERCAAAVRFVLTATMAKTGHSFLYLNELVRGMADLLELPPAWCEAQALASGAVVIEQDRVYLPEYHEAEGAIAGLLAEKLARPRRELPGLDPLIAACARDLKLEFTDEQVMAVREAVCQPVTIITGAAGTGKSTLCRGLFAVLGRLGAAYQVAAPTGKAAYKLQTLTGAPAQTIHRLFRAVPHRGFRVNREQPLCTDYLVIDEASMIDLLLLRAILDGLAPAARLVLIGDPYQLPSVEAGNSLAALASSYSIPQVVLTEVFRQARNSTILKNAGMVNLERPFPTQAAPDFTYIDTGEPQAMLHALEQALVDLRAQGFDPIRDVHVLTPLNKGGGDISVASLNLRLRDQLNPRTAANSFSVFDREFRLGDKVMQRRNDYTLDLFNGDIGYIAQNHPDAGTVDIEFFNQAKAVPHLAMGSIVLNYAMTVHKAQGSENRAVIFFATTAGCYFLLNKNLFYTAMTRAREKLVMIMPYAVVKAALRYSTRRHSHLATRLQEIIIGREPQAKP